MIRRIFLSSAGAALGVLLFYGAAIAKGKTLIVALGDSTTAGTPFFRSPLEAPPDGAGDPESQYTYWMMRRRPDWTVLNYGIGGQTTRQLRARLDETMKLRPRYVIVLGGVNDIFEGAKPKEITETLFSIYHRLQQQSIMPVAATVLPVDRATPAQAAAIDALNRWIRKESDILNIPFADLNAVVQDASDPHRLSGSPDGIHPDVGGYRAMAMALIAAIDPIEKAWR